MDQPLAGGNGGGHDGAPHRVRLLVVDDAVVGLRAVRVAAPPGGLEVVLSHQPPDPLGGRADAPVPEPRPDLAVALAVERALGQDPADVADQLLVGGRPHRPPLLGHGPLLRRDGLPGLEVVGGGAGQAEDAADPLHPVGLAGAGGGGAAQPLRLLVTKGRPLSRCWHFWPSSSLSMVSWPTLAWRRATSSSRSSAGRLFRAAVPPSRKASRQEESVAAMTPSSLERVSRSSPRSRRRTASVFRLAEKRPRSWVVGLRALLGHLGHSLVA